MPRHLRFSDVQASDAKKQWLWHRDRRPELLSQWRQAKSGSYLLPQGEKVGLTGRNGRGNQCCFRYPQGSCSAVRMCPWSLRESATVTSRSLRESATVTLPRDVQAVAIFKQPLSNRCTYLLLSFVLCTDEPTSHDLSATWFPSDLISEHRPLTSLVVTHDHNQASRQQVWNAIAELDGVLLSYVKMSLLVI